MMKFILNEKFVLNERFILDEASESVDELKKQATDAINDNFNDSLLARFNNDISKSNELGEVKKVSEETAALLNSKVADLTKYRDQIHRYADAIKAKIESSNADVGSVLNAYPGIKDSLQELIEIVDANTSNADEINEAIKQLKQKFDKVNAAIMASIKEDESESNGRAELANSINEFKDMRDDLKKGIDTTTADDDAAITEFKAFIKVANGEDISLKSLDDLTSNDDIAKKIKKAFDAFAKFNEFLSNYKSAPASASKDAEKGISDGVDWEARFNSVKTGEESKKLWDEYFNTVWGEKAPKVRALGDAFIQELLHAGFTEQSNPFITFVKNNINKLELNAYTYPAVHNAYASRLIGDDELEGKKTDNLLYNPQLYSNDAKTILEYLTLQHDIEIAADKLDKSVTDVYQGWHSIAVATFSADKPLDSIKKDLEEGTPAILTGSLAEIKLKTIGKARDAISVFDIKRSEIKTTKKADNKDILEIAGWGKNEVTQALLWLVAQYPEENLGAELNKIDLETTTLDLLNSKLMNKIKKKFHALFIDDRKKFMADLAAEAGMVK